VATNPGGSNERETVFQTYSLATASGSCPNEAVRSLSSRALPDCRAYELVTPANTGGHFLYDAGVGNAEEEFGTPTASPLGDSLYFMTLGGSIPGLGGAGSFNGTQFVSTRGTNGWSTEAVGLSGEQATQMNPGGASSDHSYVVSTATKGPAVLEGRRTVYVRLPDGAFDLVGRGSLASEPSVEVDDVGPSGSHIIFSTTNFAGTPARQLEPQAPPTGKPTIYDRTPDGVTHVVSLLPGDVTSPNLPEYLGSSAEGNAVAFSLGRTSAEGVSNHDLYLRVNDSQTFEVASSGAEFAGLSSTGGSLFFIKEGGLSVFEWETAQTTAIAQGANLKVVNVSGNGGGVFFLSTSVLTTEANPEKATAVAGGQNLYAWTKGLGLSFIGTVTSRDVDGEFVGSRQIDGLGLWTNALKGKALSADPSRAASAAGILVFASRADLTGYEAGGRVEIFRYNAPRNELSCISCNPTGVPATGDASLESITRSAGGTEPTSTRALIPNMSPSGDRIVFESTEALVPADTDGVQDVYEWEAAGVGSCQTTGGCTALISSGTSAQPNYLFGVSESGEDIFFSTSDMLTRSDTDATPSLYDARVGSRVAEVAQEIPCSGEACKAPLASAPQLPAAGSPVVGPSGNAKPAPKKSPPKSCPTGKKRKSGKAGARCAKVKTAHKKAKAGHHKNSKHQKKNGTKRKGSGK
jgi:hypothetical protein